MDIKLNTEQKRVVKDALAGKNIFLTGEGGTGKSVVIREIIKHLGPSVAVVAPTGIAALNVGGVTVHRFLGIKPSGGSPDKINPKRVSDVIDNLRTVIIDEVSMLTGHLLECIESVLRRAAKNGIPFGGKQIIVVGDFFQLPPVTKSDKPTDWAFRDNSDWGDLAWPKAGFICHQLTQQQRQLGEDAFASALNVIRTGYSSYYDQNDKHRVEVLKDAVALINSRVGVKPNDSALRLVGRNADADKINSDYLDKIQGQTTILNAEISGEFAEDLKPVADAIELKIGARVLICRNGSGYVNGDRGKFVELNSDDEAIIDLDRGGQARVKPSTWEDTQYVKDHQSGTLKRQVLGRFTQHPLKLGWAITVHKCQGMTLDSAHIDVQNWFCTGQAYVALSRLRNIEGLTLEYPIKFYNSDNPEYGYVIGGNDIQANDQVREFMRQATRFGTVSDFKLKTLITKIGSYSQTAKSIDDQEFRHIEKAISQLTNAEKKQLLTLDLLDNNNENGFHDFPNHLAIMLQPRKQESRGRPAKSDVPMTSTERSRRSRERIKRLKITLDSAAAAESLTVRQIIEVFCAKIENVKSSAYATKMVDIMALTLKKVLAEKYRKNPQH